MSRVRKGYQRGECRPMAKLTEAKVREIVFLIKTPCQCCGRLPTMAMIAAQFGVSVPLICNIINGRDWKHVTGEAIAPSAALLAAPRAGEGE